LRSATSLGARSPARAPALADSHRLRFTYQAYDNFGDQPLASFKRYIDLSADWETETDPLVYKALAMTGGGNSLGGLDHFLADAAAGTLPAVSWIVGPAELSEHPPYSPRDGAWLQAQIVDAVQKSPAYARTALLVSFDETGGWADHVVPFHSPPGTPGEWLADPFSGNQTFAGPGYRLPFSIVSPYTRGGNVFTAPADHTSQVRAPRLNGRVCVR
jgi:phospholipase C